ncbi:Nucleolar protein 16 [Mycoemilia scoparia]|uniref:Nucleolar protein 16 n=1 Tax=Mycoemilia scoparia TaxID=417184 RepID=A0A9W8DTV8_9FUNG|nr:Nucleolar protein 16 [Mycoemilia scoparia]
MANPRARKKLKNPKLRTSRRRKNPLKKANFKGHPLFKDQWDPKETLAKNYRRLGLVSKMNGIAGGIEKDLFNTNSAGEGDEDNLTAEELERRKKLADSNLTDAEIRSLLPEGYALIERDDKGNIVNIVMQEGDDDENDEEVLNKENDPLDSDYELPVVKPKTAATQALEDLANSMEKKKRWMSIGERRILQEFIEKHGDDYDAMFWDKKLNIQQYTAKQLKNRITKYLKEKEQEGY